MVVKKNTKIWIFPLEPLEQRYTKQWKSQFNEVFKKSKLKYEFIEGELVHSTLQSRFFLDPVQTNIYKSSQIQKILKRIDEIKDNDIIFLFDGWFPGIEALKYTLTFLDKKTKIMGYFHAGTYDKYDLTNQYKMEKWGKDLENSWFEIYDKIFVATIFHRGIILKNRNINENKIRVVGFPLDLKNLTKKYEDKKEYLVAFTGRKSKEKGYEDILKLQNQGFPIIVTLDKTKTKEEYYKLLSRCKYVLSTAQQETFGIGIVEGMALGCIPIVPNRLSYKETVGEYCRNENIVEEFRRILIKTKHLNKKIFIKKSKTHQYQKVINKIIKELK